MAKYYAIELWPKSWKPYFLEERVNGVRAIQVFTKRKEAESIAATLNKEATPKVHKLAIAKIST